MEWKPRALWQASKASTGKSWLTRVALQCTTIRSIFWILHGGVVIRLIMMFFRGSEAFALEAGAALHAEGAEDGGEDSDDEIDDGFPVYFHDD